ncbi:MAG: hypothetical protein ACRDTG_15795 [Pseudonocardiaceae bacterium]
MTEQQIMEELRAASRKHSEWAVLAPLLDDPRVGFHLAIMVEPFLSYLLNGQKTIESRFSKNAIAPYGKVTMGDLVLLKAGPVVGAFTVSSVDFVTLHGDSLARLRRDYAAAICAKEDEFWNVRANKRYATLTGVSDVYKLPPVTVSKRDMRGWVVLRAASLSSGDEQITL